MQIYTVYFDVDTMKMNAEAHYTQQQLKFLIVEDSLKM